MHGLSFANPVHVLTGLGFVQRIDNVAQAHAFLAGYSNRRHALAHAKTLDMCRRALRGEKSAEHARRALTAFAESASILIFAEIGDEKRAA